MKFVYCSDLIHKRFIYKGVSFFGVEYPKYISDGIDR